jgi:dienelactone hydrolase
MRSWIAAVCLGAAASIAAAAPAREHFASADVLYGWVSGAQGEKLRTYVTRPHGAVKVPVIVFVGWLSCDSMEYPDGETDGFGALMLRLIEQSGFATVRMDKPGVGESQGVCGKTDFNAELAGWRAAFAALGHYDFIDRERVFVVGISNGGGFAPLVTGGAPVRGYVAASAWGRSWYEHMIEHERRRLTAAGQSAEQVTDGVKAFIRFYDLYLNDGPRCWWCMAAPTW